MNLDVRQGVTVMHAAPRSYLSYVCQIIFGIYHPLVG